MFDLCCHKQLKWRFSAIRSVASETLKIGTPYSVLCGKIHGRALYRSLGIGVNILQWDKFTCHEHRSVALRPPPSPARLNLIAVSLYQAS